MSRARERREQARMKRQAPDHFPDVKKMVGDDDSEQFEWMDGEQPEDEDFECGMQTVLIGRHRAKSVRMLCITSTSRPLCGKNGPTLLALPAHTLTLEG